MDTNVAESLQQAYSLIETGDLETARSILKPILEHDKNNPDVWWLYAHSVYDVETARLALNNVLRIDNEYPEASDLLEKLEAQAAKQGELADTNKEPSFMPGSLPDLQRAGVASIKAAPLPAGSIETGDLAEEDDKFGLAADSESTYRRPIFFVPVIVLLLLGALAIVILRPFANTSITPATVTVEGTGQSIDPTPLVIETLSTVSTQQPFFLDQTPVVDDSLQPLYETLSQFIVPSGGIGVFDTDLGTSALVDVCTKPGTELRETLTRVMDTLAREHVVYADRVEAVGTRMLDCDSRQTLLVVGVPVESAISYAGGSLSENDFQGLWRAIRQPES